MALMRFSYYRIPHERTSRSRGFDSHREQSTLFWHFVYLSINNHHQSDGMRGRTIIINYFIYFIIFATLSVCLPSLSRTNCVCVPFINHSSSFRLIIKTHPPPLTRPLDHIRKVDRRYTYCLSYSVYTYIRNYLCMYMHRENEVNVI